MVKGPRPRYTPDPRLPSLCRCSRPPAAPCSTALKPTPPRTPDDDRGRSAFRDAGLRAKRSFGQCFLADANIARNIAVEATTPEGGTCLEIGPGTGALTRHLLGRAQRVVAIERDRDLIPVLHEAFRPEMEADRLRVVEADAAESPWLELFGDSPHPHAVVGNVPYNITGRLLERAIHLAHGLDCVVFMVQKEVADRIAAPIGTKDYGALSVFAQQAFTLRKRMFVPSSCFRPRPSVDSSVVVLQPRDSSASPAGALFYALVLAAFSRRRKTLRNAWKGWRGVTPDVLASLAQLSSISLDDRAERISPASYVELARRLEPVLGGAAS